MVAGFSLNLRLDDALRDLRTAAAAGLLDVLDDIGETSDAATPIETGDLIRSRQNRVDSDGMRGTITYTDPVAAIEHESLTEHHDPGRHPKFLETAMSERAAAALATLAEHARSELS